MNKKRLWGKIFNLLFWLQVFSISLANAQMPSHLNVTTTLEYSIGAASAIPDSPTQRSFSVTSSSANNSKHFVDYTVTFDANGGMPEPDPQTVPDGGFATHPQTPSKQGYIFLGWFESPNSNPWIFDLDPVTQDMTLTALWQLPTATVTFDSQGGTYVPSLMVEPGTTISEPNPPPTRPGYNFVGWYQDPETTIPWDFATDTVPGDMTLYAKWDSVLYTVTFDSNGGSPVDSLMVSYGSTISAPIDPIKTGYTFQGWYQDPATTTPWDFATNTVTSDITLYAKWLAGPAESAITLTKTANTTHFAAIGVPITYTYVITNTGDSFLNDLNLIDSKLGTITCPANALAPGLSVTCTAAYETTAADVREKQITNTATASASDPTSTIVQAQASLTLTLDESYIRKQTLSAIRGFLNARSQLILANGPDRHRIVNRLSVRTQRCSGKPQGHFSPNNEHVAVDAALSLSELCMPMNKWDVWTEAHGAYYQQNKHELKRHGDFGVLYVGADYLVNSSIVLGVLSEGDNINQDGVGNDIHKANGRGWMFGPYASARLMSDIYLHTRAAWGGSHNNINVFGFQEDSFRTTRSLYNAEIVGDWYQLPWKISPTLGISYYSELQPQFMNNLSILIPEQRINLGQVNLGPEFSYQFMTRHNRQIALRLALQGLYNFAYNDWQYAQVNNLSARVQVGAEYRTRSGFSITPMFTYDGVGGRAYNATEGQIQVSMPLG